MMGEQGTAPLGRLHSETSDLINFFGMILFAYLIGLLMSSLAYIFMVDVKNSE